MDEKNRIEQVYANRAKQAQFADVYGPFAQYNTYMLARQDILVGKALRKHHKLPLADKRILDVGCGKGHGLIKLVMHGAKSTQLTGIDLIEPRIAEARQKHPAIAFHMGSAHQLPYAANQFDIIMQITTFSSIIDRNLHQQIASEMTRVLRPGGIILWLDLAAKSKDPNLIPITQQDLSALFPSLILTQVKPTRLIYGLSRRLLPISWEVVGVLERISMLCTALFATMQKPD